jgi:hypothetical protein
MAIERQTPDPAQEGEEFQDMTTERSTEDLDSEIIEILSGLGRRRGSVSRRWVCHLRRNRTRSSNARLWGKFS